MKIKAVIKKIVCILKKREPLELLGDFMALLCFLTFWFTIWCIDGKINLHT